MPPIKSKDYKIIMADDDTKCVAEMEALGAVGWVVHTFTFILANNKVVYRVLMQRDV